MPPPVDNFQEWLDGFRKEVDAVVSNAALHPGADLRERASFGDWYQATQDPVTGKAPGAVEEIAKKMDSLLYEKTELERQLEASRAEEQAQKTALAQLDVVRADAARERERLETRIGQLESRGRALEEQIEALKGNRKFLEEALTQQEAAKRRADEELKLERERGLLAGAEALKLKSRVAELEAELAKLREFLAGRDGTLDELRRQASTYQDRLIHAKELTDADVALLRQELRLYYEEFRIMVNTIKKGATR